MTTTTTSLALLLSLAAFGAALAQDWQADPSLFNPSGVPSLAFSQPRFADLDADADLDLILGSLDEPLLYLRNVGTPIAPAFAPGGDVFAPVDELDAEMGVAVDLDGDGDLDLVTGGYTGMHLFANVGSASAPAFARVEGFFAGLAVGSIPVPAFADLDGDGDQDLVVGLSEDGRVRFYPNLGSPAAASFTEGSSQDWFDVGLYAYPWLDDLDGDGDQDLLVGRDGHGLNFYRNVGDETAWSWAADHDVFAGLGQDTYWNSPSLVDLNGDGLLDLVHGTDAGPLRYYVNTGTAADPVWTANTALFGGVLDVGGASSPYFLDFDGDGDLDLASGSQLGDVKYYENVGTPAAPAWRADHAYFASIDHSLYSAVALGDLDDDGLADAVVGDLNGALFLHRNTGSGFVEVPGAFAGIDVGDWSVPRLADMDGDGDLDLVVGADAGTLGYWRNSGTPQAPAWTAVAGYFGGLDVGSNSSPSLGDFDGDGDLDLMVGTLFHELRYYRHEGASWVRDDAVVAGIVVGQNAAPALADLDGDGDLDLTVGNYAGTFDYWENLSPSTGVVDPRDVPAPGLELTAAPNPFNPAVVLRYVLREPADARLTIHDVAGRLVRSASLGRREAGAHDFIWRGEDDRGRRVPAGTYLCRVVAGREARTVKVTCVE